LITLFYIYIHIIWRLTSVLKYFNTVTFLNRSSAKLS